MKSMALVLPTATFEFKSAAQSRDVRCGGGASAYGMIGLLDRIPPPPPPPPHITIQGVLLYHSELQRVIRSYFTYRFNDIWPFCCVSTSIVTSYVSIICRIDGCFHQNNSQHCRYSAAKVRRTAKRDNYVPKRQKGENSICRGVRGRNKRDVHDKPHLERLI